MEGAAPEDDSARLLGHELEGLDCTLLYQAYPAKGRNPAVGPKAMFNILTYAYPQSIYPSRKIETACKRDIHFMWLLAGQKAPDHSAIARLRTGFLASACEGLFYPMVCRLSQAEGLSKETVFIDGAKLGAPANKYTFVWRKSVGKWEEKMSHKIEEALALLNQECMQSFTIRPDARAQDLQQACRFLEEGCKMGDARFVSGKGERKSRNRRFLEMFRRFLERQAAYGWHTASFQGRNNYGKTDPGVAFMRMKDGHMRNAQLKPGYHAQIGVDGGHIVAVDNQKPYIKPQTYGEWKKRSFKKDIRKRENMIDDEGRDIDACHAGKRPEPQCIKKRKSKSGYGAKVTVYECEGCSGCPYKEKCTKPKKGKRLYVSKSSLGKREGPYRNIMSETGIQRRMNRSIQAGGGLLGF